VQNAEHKKDWTLTPRAFHRLLHWLGGETDDSGQSYLDMRRRLVAYFDRKNCDAPDELADETLNRVARRVEEEDGIISDTPAHYCYIVARYVSMEYWRGMRRNEVVLDRVRRQPAQDSITASEPEDERLSRDRLMSCLDRCTEKLESQSRDLILRYYYGERAAKIANRRELADNLGVSLNALSIRACRIRNKLEACVENCVRSQ
jgi:DNA-directed RNA polymerase specialized sigma24 family protein